MKAVHLFLETDMRVGHDGLGEVARRQGVHLEIMHPGQAALFFNAKLNKVKVFMAHGVVSYARFEDGIKPSLLNAFVDAVIPGRTLEMSKLLKNSISKALGLTGLEKVERKSA